MRLRLCALLIATLPLSALADDKSDLEQFQGTWTYESLEIDGEKANPEQLDGVLVKFSNDEVTITRKEEVLGKGRQKLDPAKSPKAIEVAYAEGPNQGKSFVGIYKIDGDTITACFAPNEKDRPKDFESKAGSGLRLVKLKRAKS